jgi:GNAT superfamily N-acetyltransferase
MVQVRRAQARDAEGAAQLCAAAAREDGLHCALDADRIKAHAFGSNAMFEVWVAEEPRVKEFAACAVITKSYDVRRAIPTIVVCELYVAPSHRRDGVARILMSALARRAMELGARELSITTGVHKEVAQRFFAAIGAHAEEATVFKMSADGIQWLASESA